MLKTIIFRAEEVIFSEDYLQLKIYEKLWQYLRLQSEWSDFETVLKFREYYLMEKKTTAPYEGIASHYLTESNRRRFEQDVQLFLKKQSHFYLRSIPAMLAIIRNVKYYYKIALIATHGPLFEKANQKYRFDRLFHFIALVEKSADIHLFHQHLQDLLKETRATTDETLLVSSYLFPDLSAGEQQGISTLYAHFSPRTRGFQPQNTNEWKYYHSLQRLYESRKKELSRQGGIEAVATDTAEISTFISQLERAESSTIHEPKSTLPENFTLWDMAREIFSITLSSRKKVNPLFQDKYPG